MDEELDMIAGSASQHSHQQLLALLELQRIEENLYLGHHGLGETGQQDTQVQPRRLFGGQVLAQAAMAAYATVEGVQLHSLHGYFMRVGTTARPVLYEIERIRDGRSFTTRRVVAIQGGEPIFNMDVSFQIQEPGFEHAQSMPNVPLPEDLADDLQTAQALSEETDAGYILGVLAKLDRPFEMRSVFPVGSDAWRAERFWNPTWIRFKGEVDPQNHILAHSLLAYASDMGVVSTASLPHQSNVTREQLQLASLDHALWVHRPVPIDEWMLFHKRTSTSQGARGIVHADFYSQTGHLIASMTQEGLLRIRG